jgi:TPP-dependent pyruvate/acetoin dehydrogenase alpha subunit
VVHLGIGSVSDGAFHEALNLAALTESKVVFVIACQSLDDGAPVGPQTAAAPADLAKAYGINVTSVDGHDAAAVHAAVSAARDLAPHVVCANL